MAQDVDMQRLVISIEANFKKYERALYKQQAKTDRSMRRIERRVGKAGANVGRLLGGPLAAVTSALGTREIGRYADVWTATANKLAAAGVKTGDVTDRQKELVEMAVRTRTAYEPIVDLYARITRSSEQLGISQKQIANVTEITAKAFKSGGASAGEQASGILQLSQALASGFLQGDELRSIRENAPVLAKAIADYYGVTIGALKKLGAEGKITSADIVAAIEAAGPRIEKAYGKTTATMADSVENLKSVTIQAIGEIDRMLGVSERVSYAINKLAKNVQSSTNDWVTQTKLGPKAAKASMKELVAGIELYERKLKELKNLEQMPLAYQVARSQIAALNNIFVAPFTGGVMKGPEWIPQVKEELERINLLKDDLANRPFKNDDLSGFSKMDLDYFDGVEPPSKGPIRREIPLPEERPQHKYVDHFANGLGDIEREIELYERRKQLIGATAGEVARANMQAEIMNRLADENISLTPRQEAALSSYLEKLKESAQAYSDAESRLEMLQQVSQSVANSMTQAFEEITSSGKLDFQKMVDSMIKDLLRLAWQMNVIKPLFGGAGSSGGGAIGQLLSGVGVFHNGGIVGAGGVTRAVSPAAFNQAPRYHTGGIAGLKPNEIPAILERGELVIPRSAVRSAGRGGASSGGDVKVNIYAPPGSSVRQEKKQDSSGGFRLDVFIDQIEGAIGQRVVEGRSQIGQSMQSRYGLDPSKGAR